jgi:uncharacterized protein (UPF0371 family)
MEKGFNTEKYLEEQTKAIMERMKKFDNKLYLEFGGKLCYDGHASRVLPGYEKETKIKLLKKLKEKIEIVYCISAKDIQNGRIRTDFGLKYDEQAVKDIDDLRERGLDVSAVVISMYEEQISAKKFKRKLENIGIDVYLHYTIRGYTNNFKLVVSDDGYGKQEYVETEKPVVIVTGTGGGSGKMSFCLAQIYHEQKKGIDSGFAKFETFPIWDFPLEHPVNIAYEAATADLGDINMIDPFFLKKYNKTAINYNRDIENFSIMQKIINNFPKKDSFISTYNSPTEMGVNRISCGITDDNVVREASKQEVIRRYFWYRQQRMMGSVDHETTERIKVLMRKIDVSINDRKVVEPARKAAFDAAKQGKGNKNIYCGAAIELDNGKIVTGKNSPLMHAESAAILNAVKELAKIPDNIDLLSEDVINRIRLLKKDVLKRSSENLNVEEIMIALAISSSTNPMAKHAVEMLRKLKDCEMHTTHILRKGDEGGLISLQMHVTTDANFIITSV